MPNMSQKKEVMPLQDPNIRNKNFIEVSLGYKPKQAIEEANRCLQCKNAPCVAGCPVYVQIPEFIKLVKEEKFYEGYLKIFETNSLPEICGRVCPQENQCEKYCVRGKKGEPVAIGRLERFVADYANENPEVDDKSSNIEHDKGKVAIVGSGPAGITCAGDLAKMGYDVTIFEAFHTAGGVLMYGIPEFRLPKKIVQKAIDSVVKLGVNIEKNMVIGKIFSIDELFQEGYEAIFIGTGAGLPVFMNIPGENLNGVMSANEFLTRINLMKAYDPKADTPVKIGKNVAVVGGGNVAMDAARCALRLGAEKVYIVYRRSLAELPARKEEVEHAEEEGIIFKLLTNPKQIIGTEDGWVKAIQCVEMELGEPDSSGRRRPIEKADSLFEFPVETVIMSIGTTPNPLIMNTTKQLQFATKGEIVADEVTGQTSQPGIFAGGDIVTGAATVIQAMGAGKRSAKAIAEYIRSKN